MEKNCIYTKEDLLMFKDRAVKEFMTHKESVYELVEMSVKSNFDFLIMQQLGKELKTLDMFRTQIISFDNNLKKFYGDK